MKIFKLISLAISVFGLFSCEKEAYEGPIQTPISQPFKVNHSKAAEIQKIMDKYTQKGLPGIVVGLKDAEGLWEGTSGYAKIENKQKLTPGLVHANGSLTKMYTAACILKLKEQNKIDLEKPITTYLPTSIASNITDADKITVKMLLSHTSGIPNYKDDVNFTLKWFNDFTRNWTWEEALAYSYNKPTRFTPGTQYFYADVNYMLLSVILTQITHTQPGEFLRDAILEPLGLKHTYYKIQPEYLEHLPMPNYYLDRYGDNRLQNISLPNKQELYMEQGEGGLVASALDYVSFMEALATGKIISPATFTLMKTPVLNDYGLGLGNYEYQGKKQVGHSGALIGVSSLMLYLEEQKTAVFIATNMNTDMIGGPTAALYYEMRNEIANYLASGN